MIPPARTVEKPLNLKFVVVVFRLLSACFFLWECEKIAITNRCIWSMMPSVWRFELTYDLSEKIKLLQITCHCWQRLDSGDWDSKTYESDLQLRWLRTEVQSPPTQSCEPKGPECRPEEEQMHARVTVMSTLMATGWRDLLVRRALKSWTPWKISAALSFSVFSSATVVYLILRF